MTITTSALSKVTYLGGTPQLKGSFGASSMYVADRWLGLGLLRPKHALVELGQIEHVEVSSDRTAKHPGAIGSGLLGTKDRATLTLYLRDGGQQIYQVDGQDAAHVVGRLLRWLPAYGIRVDRQAS